MGGGLEYGLLSGVFGVFGEVVRDVDGEGGLFLLRQANEAFIEAGHGEPSALAWHVLGVFALDNL